MASKEEHAIVELKDIKINECDVYVFDGYKNEANGLYKNVSLDQLPMTLYGNKIEYLFEHNTNDEGSPFHDIIKCKLKSHKDEMYWIILGLSEKLEIKTVNELSDRNIKLLYISKDRICAPIDHPPSFNWRCVIHQNQDNMKAPIIIKGEEYFGYGRERNQPLEKLKCSETDFNDINI